MDTSKLFYRTEGYTHIRNEFVDVVMPSLNRRDEGEAFYVLSFIIDEFLNGHSISFKKLCALLADTVNEINEAELRVALRAIAEFKTEVESAQEVAEWMRHVGSEILASEKSL